jgi:hypothetical protein
MIDLGSTLDSAETLVLRGERAFHSDAALPLAFEALSNRVGDLSKRLCAADPQRFSDPMWSRLDETCWAVAARAPEHVQGIQHA